MTSLRTPSAPAASSPCVPGKKHILSRSVSSLLVLGALGGIQPAHGADYLWGAGGLGGTGTWIDDAITANWFNGAADVPWAGGNTAIFGGTAGAVTVSGAIGSVNGITFNTTGYALNGGTLNLTAPTVTLGMGINATIGSTLAGTTGLTVAGGGTLTLTAAAVNTLTGTFTVNTGSTLIAVGDVFSATGNDAVINGTLDLSTTAALGSGRYINSLTGSGIITSSSAPPNTVTSIRVKSGDFTGTIQDGAGTGQRTALVFQATGGVLNLSGTNTYTGDTLVRDGGTLRLSSANALPAASFLRFEPGGALTATLELANGDLTRTLGGTQNAGTGGINLGAGTDYFAALGADRTVNLGAAQIIWGATAGFAPTILGFGSANATHKLTFSSPLSFNNAGRTIDVRDGAAAVDGEFTGAVTGGGGGGVLTKTGTGTLQFSAANTIGGLRVRGGTVILGAGATQTGTVFNSIGVAAGENGTLNLVGNASLTTGAVDFNVSDLAGSRGTVNHNSTGTMTLGTLYVGKNGNSVGVFNQTSGTVTNVGGGEWRIGGVSAAVPSPDVNSYGIYNMSGGTLNPTNNFQVGAGGSGVFNQSGGTVTMSGWVAPARFGAASNGLINLSGGTFTQSAASGTTLIIGEQGRAVVNVFPGGALQASSSVGLRLSNGGGATGILNVLGGTVTAQSFVDLGGTSFLYLNGGTVRPLVAQANFISGLDQLVVGPAGAFFDSNNVSATIPQALTAPSGSGVDTIPVTTGGAGYVGEPIVLIAGDGVGASARAIVTGGVVTGITITNPGVNYTTPPTITLVGGGAATAATVGAATINPNVTTGGLTKTGNGTLTLSGVNTYLGATTVIGGKLALGGVGDVNTSSAITINGAGAVFAQNSSTAVTAPVTVTNGTLTGTTTVNTAVVGAGTGGVIGNGDGTATPFTIGSLTFNGAGTFNLTTTNTTPAVLLTTTLITGATNPAGIVTLNASNTTGLWSTGTYDLISYSTLGGQGFANISRGTIAGLGSRQSAVLSNTANIIKLTISGDLPVWTGAQSGDWTTNIIGGVSNWKLQTAGTPTDYINGDSSLFDDTATGVTTLNISTANVNPASVTFNNSTLNYSVGSTGGFGIATGSVVKNGTANLTLAAPSTYAGGTTLNAGVLNLNHASAIGTGPLTINGGSFDNTSGAPVTLTTNNVQTWNVDPVFGGTNALNLGTAPLPLTATRTITTNGTATLTLGGVISGANVGINKLGPGRLELSGANTYTGTTDVNGGTLVVSGAINAANAPNIAQINAENNGTLRIVGGTVNATKTTAPAITAGNIGGSTGAIYVDGGVLNVTQELWLGSPAGGFGGLTVNAGSVTTGNWLAIGRTGNGVLDVNGGTVAVNGQNAVLASFAGANGVATLTGGTTSVTSTAGNQGAFIVGEAGTGTLTVSGTAALNISGALGVNIARAAGGIGVVNLNGGTITTPAVTKGAAGASAIFNFNGGTLRPTAPNAAFMTGLNAAYVRPGGANIDTNGSDITIAQPLLAPTGNGVSTNGLTLSGSGFITPPQIVIAGGGGTGATAIPVLDAAGNLTDIVITNPGTDYISDPIFNVIGGGGSGFINGLNVLVPLGGGGLTKVGAGTLTLGGVNTYVGETLVSGGTLLLNATGSINATDAITINGAGARLVQMNTTTPITPSITVTNGRLDGVGTANTVFVGHNTGGGIANGNGGTGALTIGNLTFQGTASVNLSTASTAPVLITTALATNAAGTITINASNVAWTNGAYNLISYSTLTGAGFSAFAKGTILGLTSRQVANLSNPAGFITLTISGDMLLWTGAGDGTWSTATQTPKNWKLKTAGTADDYIAADSVEFDDTATGAAPTVTIAVADVSPTSMTFNNATKDYTIAGAFGISGGLLTKNGAGALTLATNNTYPSGTFLNAGKLNVNTASAIGTGALTINGGTLDNTSAAALTLTTNNAVNVNGDFTFAGTRNLSLGEGNVTLGGSGSARTVTVAAGVLGVGTMTTATGLGLTKAGPGTLQFSTVNNAAQNFLGGELNVLAGAVGIGGRDLVVGGLTGSGTVENGSATGRWIYVRNNVDTTFNGTLQNGAAGGRLGLNKQGTGMLTLTGTSGAGTDYFGVESGAIRLTGTQNVGGGDFGQVNVANIANQTGLLSIEGGTLNANKTTLPSLSIGGAAGAQGVLRLTSGTINTAQEMWVGGIANAYGAFSMSGGTVNVGNWLAVGRNGNGILNMSGGTLNVTTQNFTNGSFAGGQGVTNLSGGTVNVTNTAANQGEFIVAEAGAGTLNISGTAALNVAGPRGLRLAVNGAVGVVNLTGGTITTTQVQNGPSNGQLYFNGGTLKASASTPTFMQGLTSAYVQSGGAIIDDSGFNIGIGQSLLAPTDSGLGAIEVTSGGTGYLDTPIVNIGGGSGFGATAIANVSGGVVTGFTITNPGTGYQPFDFLTATLLGGGATAPASTGILSLLPNTGGGLTKKGTGVTTLSGFNSYTGATVIESGTLAVTGSITGTSSINVRAGANFDVSGVPGGFALGAAQTLKGDGTVQGNVATIAGAKLSPGQSPGTLAFTGNLDLTLAVTPAASASLVFELGTTSDKITLTGGTLTLGDSVLGIDDFAFSNAGGLASGNYTLFDASSPIAGMLDAANLSGTIAPGFTGTLFHDTANFDVVLIVVPEPSSLTLLGAALGVLAGLRRRRAK